MKNDRRLLRVRLGLLGFLIALIVCLALLGIWSVTVFGIVVLAILVYFFPGDLPSE